MDVSSRMRVRVLGFACALAVLVAGIPTALAVDTSTCSSGSGVFYYSGAQKDFAAVHGARGDLEGQTLNLCSPSDARSGSSVWVGVGPSMQISGKSGVQVGLTRCVFGVSLCDNTMNYFYAWGRNQADSGCSGYSNRDPNGIFIGDWAGTTKTYIVSHSSNLWKFFVGGYLEGQVAEAEICWSPKRATYLGEAWDFGDAIGGLAGNKYAMSALRYMSIENGNWLNPSLPSCTFTLNPFFCERAAGDALNLWSAH